MEVSIGQNGCIELNKVYNPIELRTDSNEMMIICMRDSGFEFMYEGDYYHAKNGEIKKIEKALSPPDGELPQAPTK